MPDTDTAPSALEGLPSILDGDDPIAQAMVADNQQGEDAAGEAGEVAEVGGENPTEAAAETPAATDPAAASEKPEWATAIEAMQKTLAAALEKITAAPQTATSQQAAAKVEAQQDRLADIEKLLAEPNFDAYEKSPSVIKSLVEEIRAIRQGQVEAKQQAAAAQTQAVEHEKFWAGWAKANPEIGRKAGEDLWKDAADEAQADAALASPQEKLGAAKWLFAQKVKAEKAKKAAATTTTTTTAPPRSGGRVAAGAGRGAADAPKGKALEDRLAAGEFRLSDELG